MEVHKERGEVGIYFVQSVHKEIASRCEIGIVPNRQKFNPREKLAGRVVRWARVFASERGQTEP